MKLVKTFLLLLIISVLAMSKTGYAATDSNSWSTDRVVENASDSGEMHDVVSFKHYHQPLDLLLFGIDLQEDEEEEDSNGKKRSAQLLPCSIVFESTPVFIPTIIGCSSKTKGISETQSIRLHLINEQFQI